MQIKSSIKVTTRKRWVDAHRFYKSVGFRQTHVDFTKGMCLCSCSGLLGPWYAWLVGNGVWGDGDDMYMGALNVYLIW